MKRLSLNFEVIKSKKADYPGAEKDQYWTLYADVPELDFPEYVGMRKANKDTKIFYKIKGSVFQELGQEYFETSNYRDVGWGDNGRHIRDKKNGMEIASYRGDDITL